MEKLTIIVGPTASGKTDYALRLAQQLGGAVISADSRQLYAGMNIGTAKPEAAWQDEPHEALVSDKVSGIPHYLFNIRRPNEQMTLPEWQAAAFQAIDHALAQNTPAILAGGTMLYSDSVVFNYDIPNIAPDEKLRANLEAQTAEDLYAELQAKDPDATQFIQPKNKRRIIRALEVMAATNKTFSALRRKRKPKYACEIVGLFPGWDILNERIATRVDAMLERGLLEETTKLREQYGVDLPLLRTMNYAEAAGVLDKKMSKKEARYAAIRANVRYARRQMSWWRGRKDIWWVTTASFPEPT